MVKEKETRFTVSTTGVGRKDYSLDVEFSVEPIVRSYQSSYVYDEVYALTGGQTRTIDIPVSTGYVRLLYDFLLSCPANVLLGFIVQSVEADGTVNNIFEKVGYQRIEHRHDRGAPIFNMIRVTITNYSDLDLTSVALNLTGISMTTDQYYLEVSAS